MSNLQLLVSRGRPSGPWVLARPLSGLLAGLLAVSLAACGAGEGSDGASGDTSSDDVTKARDIVATYEAAVTDYPAVSPFDGVAELRGKTVWYVPIGAAVPVLTATGTSMTEALGQAGVNVHVCDGKFVPTAVGACLQQAGTSGADAVVTSYVDYALAPAAFDALVAQKVPVLLAGAMPPDGITNTQMLSFDDTADGLAQSQELLANAVIADSAGAAHVLYLGVTDSPALKSGADHAEEFFGTACGGCTFTRVDYNTASLSKLTSQVSAELIKDPSIDYVLGEVDASGAATIAALQAAGRTDDVVFAATGGDLDAVQRIKDGQVQFTDVGTSPSFMGWRFADGVLRMLAGETPATTDVVLRVFTADNVGDLDLTPEAYSTNSWYGDDSYKDEFLGSWGLS
jgi:ribose transport system substrate-binding protein